MRYYWVGTATGDIYFTAEGYFLGGDYELNIEGQQPYVCFYKGSRNNHVGMFILKNITGWLEINEKQYRNKNIYLEG